MPDWSFSNLRRSDSKDKRLPPETKTKPSRATTVPQDVQGSTTTLTRSFTSSTMPKNRAFRFAKQIFTRAPSQQSLMSGGRTASPSSSIDDATIGSSPPPKDLVDQRRNSSTSSILVSKDDAVFEKGSGDDREMVATRQTTADIQATLTESGDQPSNTTTHDAPSLPAATGALTPDTTFDGNAVANLIPSGETLTSDDNETVSEDLSAGLGDVPSPIVLVTNFDDPPSSTAQPDVPSVTEVALAPQLLITAARPTGPSSSSPGSSITAPVATEPTVLIKETPTNPPAIVCDVTSNALGSESDKESVSIGFPVEPNLTPSPQAPSKSSRAKIAEIPVADVTPDSNADDPPAQVSQSRGPDLHMTIALSPIAEETPDPTRETPIGTDHDAPRTKPMHDDGQILNILFFGETGAGKSSVINMLVGSDFAGTSNAADGKTSNPESFTTTIDGQPVKLWDTAGLNEAERGTVPAKVAMQNLRDLVGEVKEGISLLVYCVRATRFRQNLKDNHDLVHGTICQGKVPVFLVVTGLENQVPMNEWWEQNEADFSLNGMSFDGHACVTSTKGKQREGGHMYDTEFQESQLVLRKLIKDYFAKPRPSWTIEDNKTWAAETSAKIDNYYDDGGNRWVQTNDGGSDGSPAPPTQPWWEYVQSLYRPFT